jgi:hypothetical protein
VAVLSRKQKCDILHGNICDLDQESRGDPFAGRKTYRLLAEESFDASVKCNSPCLLMGHEPYNTLGLRISKSMKPQVLSFGLLSDPAYAKMYDDLKHLSKDTKSFVTYARFFSSIGRKNS